jgi:hypothetical protein
MENKMPQTKENSLPFYWKNICRFFGKSTCRLHQRPDADLSEQREWQPGRFDNHNWDHIP